MKVTKKLVRDYHKSLNAKQKEDAFVELVDLLVDTGWLAANQEGKIYWQNSGNSIV